VLFLMSEVPLYVKDIHEEYSSGRDPARDQRLIRGSYSLWTIILEHPVVLFTTVNYRLVLYHLAVPIGTVLNLRTTAVPRPA